MMIVCVCEYMYTIKYICRSEDNIESLFSPYTMGSGNDT